MGLFALIAVAGFSLLETVLRTQERTETRLRRLSEIQRALFVMASDFDQVSGGLEGTADGVMFQKIDAAGRTFIVRYGHSNAVLVRTVSGPSGERTQPILRNVSDARWSYQLTGAIWAQATPVRPAAALITPDSGVPALPPLAVRAVAIDLVVAGPDGRPATVRRLIATPELTP